MYNQISITTLNNRIGWAKPLKSDFPIEISEENLLAESGRYFNTFHQLVTVENIIATIINPDIQTEAFNAYLSDFRKQCVLEVVTEVMDKNKHYLEEVDYSEVIIKRSKLFDDAIGLCAAVKTIEMFISSNRKNSDERNTALAYNILKIELEDVRNEQGRVVSKGLRSRYKQAINAATNLIFPDPIIIKAPKAW